MQPGICPIVSASLDNLFCPNALHRLLSLSVCKPSLPQAGPTIPNLLGMRLPCTCGRRSRRPVLLPRSTLGACRRRQRRRAGTRRRLIRRGLTGRPRRGGSRALRPRPLQRRVLRDGRLHAVHGQPVRHHAHLDRHLGQRRVDDLRARGCRVQGSALLPRPVGAAP